MVLKFLSAFLLLFILNSSFAEVRGSSPFFNEALGKCFKSEELFVRNVFGESGLRDSNIDRSKEGAWTWIVDQTAAKNYSWYLLRSGRGGLCLTAYIPAASSVQFQSANSKLHIKAFVAPEADLPAKLIDLKRAPRAATFLPSQCNLLFSVSAANKKSRKPISCEKIYD